MLGSLELPELFEVVVVLGGRIIALTIIELETTSTILTLDESWMLNRVHKVLTKAVRTEGTKN